MFTLPKSIAQSGSEVGIRQRVCLADAWVAQAIQLNVMLFMFNVFFPMYPMDGAKLIVCTLQLFCSSSARCAARVLVYTSIPLSILFIGNSLLGSKCRHSQALPYRPGPRIPAGSSELRPHRSRGRPAGSPSRHQGVSDDCIDVASTMF